MANNFNAGTSSRYPSNRSENKKDVTKPIEPLTVDTYVQRAEQVIKTLKEKDRGNLQLTTSQIRNILSMINQIYNDVIMTTTETLSGEVQSQLQYLKVKLIYTAGRHKPVKDFVQESQIALYLDGIGNSREKFILYSRYMEALVAYHRFYGGKD